MFVEPSVLAISNPKLTTDVLFGQRFVGVERNDYDGGFDALKGSSVLGSVSYDLLASLREEKSASAF